ncbi:hypothetical protein Y032_0266g732 [Ancylostoma ceylanicum]|uniref:Uncharacterized protein n=1 Tax=Ancylostoma ceylanicum TaxID=53326 RepID=A0A016S9D5_9BILA|nr:hypothetical protein Y032_0266g732 [Ancylostoma ceylanicum]
MVYLCLAPYESKQVGVAGGLSVPITVACVRPSFPHDDTHPLTTMQTREEGCDHCAFRMLQLITKCINTMDHVEQEEH